MKLIRNHFCADYSSLVLIGAFPNTRAHHNPNVTFGFLFYGIEKVIVTPESLEASSMTLWAKLVLLKKVYLYQIYFLKNLKIDAKYDIYTLKY